jgi:hypothetical protein
MTDNFPETAEKNADATASWACPTCMRSTLMPYCEACGERKPHPHELTLIGLCRQAFEAFTSYDSRLLQTFRKLMFAPGSLTLLYLQGSRKPYLGPFGLFLVANVLFVITAALADTNAFSMPLAKHLNEQPWSDLPITHFNYAEHLVTGRLEATDRTLAAYTPVFDAAVTANSKVFLFMMVFPLALVATLMFSGQQRPFATHLGFSLHFHAFLLTFISCVMLFMWLEVLFGGEGLSIYLTDLIVSFTLLAVSALYIYISAVKIYQPAPYAGIFKASLLVFTAVLMFLGYRFLLFVFTLYTT